MLTKESILPRGLFIWVVFDLHGWGLVVDVLRLGAEETLDKRFTRYLQ